jgi:hypothetical protein
MNSDKFSSLTLIDDWNSDLHRKNYKKNFQHDHSIFIYAVSSSFKTRIDSF